MRVDPCQHLVYSDIFNLSYSGGSIVESHCDFNFHFPSDSLCGVRVYVLTHYLYIFSGEVSIQIQLTVEHRGAGVPTDIPIAFDFSET